MGKKDKKRNKNKMSGQVKTALKTEKNLNAKQKRELAALGEVNFVSFSCSPINNDDKYFRQWEII